MLAIVDGSECDAFAERLLFAGFGSRSRIVLVGWLSGSTV